MAPITLTPEFVRAALKAEVLEQQKREAEHSFRRFSDEELEAMAPMAPMALASAGSDPDLSRNATNLLLVLERRRTIRLGQ